jgi:hypothetical protein
VAGVYYYDLLRLRTYFTTNNLLLRLTLLLINYYNDSLALLIHALVKRGAKSRERRRISETSKKPVSSLFLFWRAERGGG